MITIVDRVSGWFAVPRFPAAGMAGLRIGYGIAFILTLLSNAAHWDEIWGSESAFTRERALESADWTAYINFFTVSDADWWTATVLVASFVVAVAFTVGYRVRLTTVLLFLLFWSVSSRNPMVGDGGDNLMALVLLFLCFGDTCSRFSVDSWIATKRGTEGHGRDLFLPVRRRFGDHRVPMANAVWLFIVVQTCVLYITAGLAKVQGEFWQDGTAIHYILSSSEFSTWPALSSILTSMTVVTVIATYATVLLQVFFPFLIFNRYLKIPTFLAVTGMHLGIAVFMGLPSFSLVMIATELVFIPDRYWRKLGTIFSRPHRDFQTVDMPRVESPAREYADGARL